MDFGIEYTTASGESKRTKITVASWEGETTVRSIFAEAFPGATVDTVSAGSRCSDARL